MNCDCEMSVTATRYEGLGWHVESSISQRASKPQYISLWVDRSGSMRTTLESTGPVVFSFLSDTHEALGAFDISVFFFNGESVCLLPNGSTNVVEVGDWRIESSDDLRRLLESIRAHWHPSSTTNVLGAMCKGLTCVGAWLKRNTTGFATIMVTSDGDFDSKMSHTELIRGAALEHRCTRDNFGAMMATQLSAISVHVALHFVGVNGGTGSAQLKAVRDAFLAHEAELFEPMLHEFGGDTDTRESVRRVFPTACGALMLRVRHSSTSFGYTPVTLHPGGMSYLEGSLPCLTIVDATDGASVRFKTVQGVVTDAIKRDFAQAAREREFKAEIQRAIEVGPDGPDGVFRALRDFADVASAQVMRQASQATDASGARLPNVHIIANLRAASSQL